VPWDGGGSNKKGSKRVEFTGKIMGKYGKILGRSWENLGKSAKLVKKIWISAKGRGPKKLMGYAS